MFGFPFCGDQHNQALRTNHAVKAETFIVMGGTTVFTALLDILMVYDIEILGFECSFVGHFV